MQLFYFVVDDHQQIWKAPPDEVERLWQGQGRADKLDFEVGDELRLISVLCDEEIQPKICFFLRADLQNGRVTTASRIDAYEAVGNPGRRRYDHPAAQRQFTGWPEDWQTQLAVALDVPAWDLRKIGIGGPLLMSDLWGISVAKVLEYFELANDEHDI